MLGKSHTLTVLSQIYLKMNHYEEAILCLQSKQAIARDLRNVQEEDEASKSLGRAYREWVTHERSQSTKETFITSKEG